MANIKVTVKKRLYIQRAVFLAILGLIYLVGFGYNQIVRSQELEEKALNQWTRKLSVVAKRGAIYDRNGEVLADSGSCDAVIVRPSSINDPYAIAERLSQILEMDYTTVLDKLMDKSKSEIWLKRQLTPEQSQLITDEKEKEDQLVKEQKAQKKTDPSVQVTETSWAGVVLTDDKMRYYPMGAFLSQVLGFTSVDGDGQEGLEAYYNKYLKGTNGQVIMQSDAVGREIADSIEEYVLPEDGNDITLTVDIAIQSFLEEAVQKCYEEQHAKNVFAVAMDPSTGAILGMVNYPDYDNNSPNRSDMAELTALSRNTIISDAFEMGSTFKIVTMASALQSGAISTSSTFFCPGYKLVDGQKIKCWSNKPHGTETLEEAAQNSCNPAFMTMALAMGTDTFYDYLYQFGFGSKTGIDLYGEATGIVTASKYIKNVDLARIGFGQAIAVTPLQLVTAVSAVVNGGNLMKPYIVSSVKDQDGNVLLDNQPEVVRQVISPEVSNTMRQVLQSVVDKGSGRNAASDIYTIGGKTGTAQKYENGKIAEGKYLASFIGFAPADNPKIVILMGANEASGTSIYGSIICAPYVGDVIESALKYMNVPSNKKTEEVALDKTTPDCKYQALNQAIVTLQENGLNYVVEGTGGDVVTQIPAAGEPIASGGTVMLYLEQVDDESEYMPVEVPDLTGKSALEVNNLLSNLGLKLVITNYGSVAQTQSPAAGETLYVGDNVSVAFGDIPPGTEGQ